MRVQGLLSSFTWFSEALLKGGSDSRLESEVREELSFRKLRVLGWEPCVSTRGSSSGSEWILVRGLSGPKASLLPGPPAFLS